MDIKHYIKVDANSRIIDGWSDGPHPDKDTTDAILLRESDGYQFRLYPDGPENPPLYNDDAIPLYKWDGKKVIPRTDAEIQADIDALPEPQLPPDYFGFLDGLMEGFADG